MSYAMCNFEGGIMVINNETGEMTLVSRDFSDYRWKIEPIGKIERK